MFIRALQSTHLNTLNYLTSHVLLNLKQHQQSNAGQVSFKERSEVVGYGFTTRTNQGSPLKGTTAVSYHQQGSNGQGD